MGTTYHCGSGHRIALSIPLLVYTISCLIYKRLEEGRRVRIAKTHTRNCLETGAGCMEVWMWSCVEAGVGCVGMYKRARGSMDVELRRSWGAGCVGMYNRARGSMDVELRRSWGTHSHRSSACMEIPMLSRGNT